MKIPKYLITITLIVITFLSFRSCQDVEVIYSNYENYISIDDSCISTLTSCKYYSKTKTVDITPENGGIVLTKTSDYRAKGWMAINGELYNYDNIIFYFKVGDRYEGIAYGKMINVSCSSPYYNKEYDFEIKFNLPLN